MATAFDKLESEPQQPTFDPFDPELWVNSYPILERLRDADPVYVEPALGLCAVTGHAEAERIFRDQEGDHRYVDYQKQRMGDDVEQQPYCHDMSQWVLMRSGPDHRRLRGTISRDFTPKRVEALREDLVELANGLIDRFADAGRVELVENYANALPLAVISRLLGVPADDQERIEGWMRGFKHAVEFLPMTPDELAETNAAIAGLGAYFRGLINTRRQDLGDDLLSALIVQADAGAMTEEELVVNAWGLYAAGHETSGNAICDAINTLINQPEQLQQLCQDWSLLPNAVHELLRFEGPGLATNRLFPHDMEVGEHVIPANTPVVLFMAGANRDPRKFPDPDRLDLRRKDASEHLGFGHGPHRCVGQHLARLTIAVAIQTLFTRLRDLRVLDIEWSERTVFHGPSRMQVSWSGTNDHGA